jgi:hypothetical protein
MSGTLPVDFSAYSARLVNGILLRHPARVIFAMRMDGSGWKKLSGYEDGLPGGLQSR